MPSRQDQLESYQFSVQRVVAALVTHDSDPAQSPFRRTVGATMVGALVATLALAGVIVYGVLAGGDSGEWADDSAVFVEKDSGAKYVYLSQDRKLHPVLNYSSALLLANSTQPRPKGMSRKSLAKADLGPRLGIAGAPDSLPARGDLSTGPWAMCSQRDRGAATGGGGGEPSSLLIVGGGGAGGMAGGMTGGHVLATPKTGVVAEALLVATGDGQQYLIYNNHRFRIPQPQVALTAFSWSGRQPAQVATALVNALPAGADVRPLAIAGRGQPAAAPRGAKVGQLYTTATPGGGHEYAVSLPDGVLDISQVQANLLLADPQAAGGGQRAVEVNNGEYSALPRSGVKNLASQPGVEPLPSAVPALVDIAESACVSVPNAAGQKAEVRVDAGAPGGANVTDTPSSTATGTVLADRVAVPRGSGVLVEAASSPNAPRDSGALSVVTDAGTRYPIADRGLLPKLGYGGVTPVRMPAELVAMLPAGPALDPQAARTRS